MSRTFVTQSRIASLIASLSVRLPEPTPTTSAPSSRMRKTFGSWRRMSSSPMYTVQSSPSSAAAVAVATPCWPAPVSAITRGLPMRRVRSPCPIVLLILWAPVCSRSSRFSQISTPASSERRRARNSGEGRPTKFRSSDSSSAWKPGSAKAVSASRSSSSSAAMIVSGTNRPPYSPK